MMEIDNPDPQTSGEYIEAFYGGGISMNGELAGIDMPMSTLQGLCISNSEDTIKEAITKLKWWFFLLPEPTKFTAPGKDKN